MVAGGYHRLVFLVIIVADYFRSTEGKALWDEGQIRLPILKKDICSAAYGAVRERHGAPYPRRHSYRAIARDHERHDGQRAIRRDPTDRHGGRAAGTDIVGKLDRDTRNISPNSFPR